MSVTNPKNVVTEERLAEFYSQILPYLGGMPDVYSNAFSKSNLYSKSEKIIGQWWNGKPVYQKVVVIDGDFQGLDQLIYTFEDTEVDRIIKFNLVNVDSAFGHTDSAYNRGIYFKRVNNHLGVYCCTGNGTKLEDPAFIFQYTKVSDAPIAISDGNTYSTDEHMIGTWIDGKPLYQKVISVDSSSPIVIQPSETIITQMADISIDTLVSARFLSKNASGASWVVSSFGDVRIGRTSNGVWNAAAGSPAKVTAIIIQYTKATS